ncbi:hypothetical protein BDQ17DRAFT_174614 [Cyathus striatus]|nr:hypothetical protein BDQ17DRAFT_174614 [Cyathus striatus]
MRFMRIEYTSLATGHSCAQFLLCFWRLLHCGSGLAVGILSSQKESILNLNSYLSIRIAQGIWTVTCAGCDVIIALCMSFFLSRQKSSLYPSTQAIIARLLRLIVGYGALTGAVKICALVNH